MAEGIQLRLTHAQRVLLAPPYAPGTTRTSSILIDDIRESENQRGLQLQPQYVPSGGSIDLDYTSSVARSYETGDIRRLIDQGEITHRFFVGGRVQFGMEGPVVITATAGAPTPDVHTGLVDESLFIVDTSLDPVTINLPSGLLHRKGQIRIIDIGGNAAANNITVVSLNPQTIDGGANFVITANNGMNEFFWDAANTNWFEPVKPGGTPAGAAGGDLSGNYPNPAVAAITTTTGPTSLVVGAVGVGQVLQRVGATIVGVAPGGGATPIATAATPYAASASEFVEVTTGAGAFTVNLPNPGVAGDRIVIKKVDAGAGFLTVSGNGLNIDGAATFPAFNIQYQSVTVFRGTAQWWVE